MNIRNLIILVASLIFAGNALADDGEALAKKKNCTNCHDVAKNKVGPAFKDIAAKYGNDAGAHAALESKVRTGGKGAWGSIPMPPTPKSVSDDEIKSLVQWMLSLK